MKKSISVSRFILFLAFISSAFIGSDCENFLGLQGGSLLGSWELVKMEGNLQDVCLGEIAEFQQSQAVLTCPGQSPVTRAYTYDGSVLTYTSSNIKYDVSFTQANGVNKMILQGKGIERILTYDKIN